MLGERLTSYEHLANVFEFSRGFRWSQVGTQDTPEQFEEHLETDTGDGWVVATFTELVADEGVFDDMSVLVIHFKSTTGEVW